MSETHETEQMYIIRELAERVNRLSGQVAALSAVIGAVGEMGALQPKSISGVARDLAAKKIGGASVRTEPSDIAARYVFFIVEASQVCAPTTSLPQKPVCSDLVRATSPCI